MMVDVYHSFAEPLSHEMLFRWHQMLMKGSPQIDAGQYRAGKQAMQVVSGAIHAPKIHFEAPPSSKVPKEMGRFLQWFNVSAPGSPDALPALTRAGIAHIYFESIHPLEDGNGRIGRAVSEKALAQALGRPSLIALSSTILLRRKAYYAALEDANKSNQISLWLVWFAGTIIEAQRRSTARIEFLIAKARLLDSLRGKLNERQQHALLRVLREGPEGFKGGLSAGNYATITGASTATATRDLADMVAKGALTRAGERRHARYFAAIPLATVAAVHIDQQGNFT
jgi:Fic family protein